MSDNESDAKKPAVKAAEPAMSGVSVKLPPFWRGDPQIWFAQAEAQFATRQITREITKYSYIISVLQPEVAQEVRDLLIDPPADNQYTALKEQLIQRTTASEQRRVQMLLTEEELGDRKPSQLLRRMQQLAGGQSLEKGILKQLFLQRLPPSVRLILASTSDSLSLSDVADLADRIIEVHVPMVSAVAPSAAAVAPATVDPVPPRQDSDLRQDLAKLTKMVQDLQTQVRGMRRSASRGRSKSPARSRNANSSTSNDTSSSQPASDLCWYHNKFGDNATRCRPPCVRAHEMPENGQTSH